MPLAPTTCRAGRSPLGRIGSTLADVCTSSRRTSSEGSTPPSSSRRVQHVAQHVGADGARAADLRPSLASVSAVPPAEPAAVIRISSTSAPPWPAGISSTGRARMSATCTPIAIALTAPPSSVPVSALQRRRDHGGALVVVEHPRLAQARRARYTPAAHSSSSASSIAASASRAHRDRAVAGHQRGGPALERGDHRLGQRRRAERRVGRHGHVAAEREHRVVHTGQLVEHAGDARWTWARACAPPRRSRGG